MTSAIVIETVGYLAAATGLYSTYSRTMIPLRIASIGANLLFLAYGLLKGIWPTVIVNCVLLPLNAYRLHDMWQLVRNVQLADRTDLNVEWIRPYVTRVHHVAGEELFKAGDVADAAYYIFAGEVEMVEIGARLGPRSLFGEMALLTPENRRMAGARCVVDAELGRIDYDDFKQLYFQNPEFGLYLMRLMTQRMQNNHEAHSYKIEPAAP